MRIILILGVLSVSKTSSENSEQAKKVREAFHCPVSSSCEVLNVTFGTSDGLISLGLSPASKRAINPHCTGVVIARCNLDEWTIIRWHLASVV